MSAKNPSYAAHAAEVEKSNVPDVLGLLGGPIADPFKAKVYSDGRARIVRTLADVKVGDLAYSGSVMGVVTGIVKDAVPANVGIQVTYHTPYRQNPMDATVSDRVVVFNILDNEEGSGLGGEKTYFRDSMTGRQVMFIEGVALNFSVADSTLVAATGIGTADGVDTDAITVTVHDADGNAETVGGRSVALQVTGDAVLSTVTDNGDGTYTATVSDATAETVTVTATVDGTPITATDDVVFS